MCPGLQGVRWAGPAYRGGGPVVAVHKAVLAVEVIVLGKLWEQHTQEANALLRREPGAILNSRHWRGIWATATEVNMESARGGVREAKGEARAATPQDLG